MAPEYGAHVALTGGTLYKDGPRKDVDLLFYRIRQVKEIDRPRLIRALQRIGIEISKRHGWVQKAFYEGKPIDLFFRSEEHTSELQSLMRISYAVFCLKKKKNKNNTKYTIKVNRK